jgi:hypothetical protein
VRIPFTIFGFGILIATALAPAQEVDLVIRGGRIVDGTGNPSFLGDIAIRGMYMCDGENSRIIKVNLDGQILGVLSSYGKIPGKVDVPHYIAVDSTGAIYVAEVRNWRVQKFVK